MQIQCDPRLWSSLGISITAAKTDPTIFVCEGGVSRYNAVKYNSVLFAGAGKMRQTMRVALKRSCIIIHDYNVGERAYVRTREHQRERKRRETESCTKYRHIIVWII